MCALHGTELGTLISKERLAELSNDSDNNQIDKAVVDLHLNNAEGEINAALAKGGYAVPVATPLPAGSEIIKSMALWLGL